MLLQEFCRSSVSSSQRSHRAMATARSLQGTNEIKRENSLNFNLEIRVEKIGMWEFLRLLSVRMTASVV
jgi:hypothetical protein